MDNTILLQKQVRDNSSDLQSEFLDMKNWEEQMKKADMEIRNSVVDQVLPPVRKKKKSMKETQKTKEQIKSPQTKRIKGYDYSSWDKFDVDAACEALDKESNSDDEAGEAPLSKEELEKSSEEATKHKERGNVFVQQRQWAKAVGCYNEAIKIFPYDAVFYANRALCHLKLDNLHSAEADCTAAVQLDEFYTKAYHRRATARIELKQYKEAAQDIKRILKLEPSNKEAKAMLVRVNKFIDNAKPVIITSSDEVLEEKDIDKKIAEKLWGGTPNNKKSDVKSTKQNSKSEKQEVKKSIEGQITDKILGGATKDEEKIPEWVPEIDQDVGIVKIITKPPHQRSKKPLRTVPIEEIEFGAKVQSVRDEKVSSPNTTTDIVTKKNNGSNQPNETEVESEDIPESPKTAVQFIMNWRKNKSLDFRYRYFKQIAPELIPTLFKDSMESNTFSEILQILRLQFAERKEPVFKYLKFLSEVKRFRALAMFMSKSDKEDLKALFDYAENEVGAFKEDVKELMVKYEM